jgi:Family of unknown function (DUF5681)
MTKRNASAPSDYAVGYGRPPKETQFQPGKSGNPNGRRKGSRSVGAVLNDVFRQKIEVTENGKTRRVTALEAMACRLRNDALRGDAKAIKLSIELIRRHSETNESTVQFDDLLAQDRQILAQYLPDPGHAKKGDGDDPEDAD